MKTAVLRSFPGREMDTPFPIPEKPLDTVPADLSDLLMSLFPEKKHYYQGQASKTVFIHSGFPVDTGLFPWCSADFFPLGIEDPLVFLKTIFPFTKFVFHKNDWNTKLPRQGIIMTLDEFYILFRAVRDRVSVQGTLLVILTGEDKFLPLFLPLDLPFPEVITGIPILSKAFEGRDEIFINPLTAETVQIDEGKVSRNIRILALPGVGLKKPDGILFPFPLFHRKIPVVHTAITTRETPGGSPLCINCLACVDYCPSRINPSYLYHLAVKENFEAVEAAGILRCIDCGLCSFVCPVQLPLSSELFKAKKELAQEES
ncbi:MAG: 4Fe-4S dicluster domain-containing protein [Clostridia bacterium]